MCRRTEELVRFIVGGGDVQRFHTKRTILTNTVAEHSFGVAWFTALMRMPGQVSSTLLLAALSHDLAEQETGDVPAPAKRNLGVGEAFDRLEDSILAAHGLSYADDLSAEDRRTLKIADCLDGMVFCTREYRLGNTEMRVVWERYREYIAQLNGMTARELEVIRAVVAMWPGEGAE